MKLGALRWLPTDGFSDRRAEHAPAAHPKLNAPVQGGESVDQLPRAEVEVEVETDAQRVESATRLARLITAWVFAGPAQALSFWQQNAPLHTEVTMRLLTPRWRRLPPGTGGRDDDEQAEREAALRRLAWFRYVAG